ARSGRCSVRRRTPVPRPAADRAGLAAGLVADPADPADPAVTAEPADSRAAAGAARAGVGAPRSRGAAAPAASGLAPSAAVGDSPGAPGSPDGARAPASDG